MRRYALVVAVGLVACGKSKDSPSIERSAEAAPPPAAQPRVAVAPPAAKPARSGEHVVYSLVDNRLSGHLRRGGGLFVEGGSAGFAKYTRIANQIASGGKRPWELHENESDTKVARMAGKEATVYVPLTADQAKSTVLRMKVFAKDDGTVSVKVNDNKDLNAHADKGWATLEFTVPAGQLHEGENALAIFGKSLELSWLQVGGTAQDDLAFYDGGSHALVIPQNGGMSWFVAVPPDTRLEADVSDKACSIAVTATSEDGQVITGKLAGAGAALDLAPLANKAARLDLDNATCPTARLTSAQLAQKGDGPVVKRGDPPKYVLFVVMDSLRADRIRAINPKARPETPNWDKLAETSALFVNTYVQGNESQVSHASIWSSNYLAKHKAIEMKDHLADKWMTIDEVAKAGGKYVAGASGNGYIRPSRGFGSAWNQFINHIEKGLGLKGADIVEQGWKFISPRKDQPWFLYLGLIDTHVTWRAKQPWMDKYDGGYKGRFATEYGDDGPHASNGKDLTEKEQDHVRALYDSNVSYQDDLLGQIEKKLTDWGIWDQTMLVVIADHGDEQWEDGRVGHGGSERETLLHVPLLIHYPPLFPASKVAQAAEAIDIVPTLADALGVAADPEWQGMSLVAAANGIGGYPMMSFSSQYENSHAGRIGHWKVKLMGTGTPHVWDLGKDPDERKDVYNTAGSEIGTRLVLDPLWIIRNWNVEWKKAQWGNAADVSNRFAADLGE